MSWSQVKIFTDISNAALISEMLPELGAVAVTLQSASEQLVLEPPIGAAPLWQQTYVIGLFSTDADIKNIMTMLEAALDLTTRLVYETELVTDKNWERAWIEHYKPMQFGEKLWICPSWCEAPEPQGINILLDPGLAFGTGTHPTTALCLEWLAKNPPVAKTIIDYGCGSGILGIAAAKLGAAAVLAVDYDPQAIIATIDNAKRNSINNILEASLPSEFAESISKNQYCADIILANILAQPLLDLAAFFAEITHRGSTIVLSGILKSQTHAITEKYSQYFEINTIQELEDWVLVAANRK